MNTPERVLKALKCEEPDRVPIFVYLNPYDQMGLQPGDIVVDQSYQELMAVTEEYADVIYDHWFVRSACELACNGELTVNELGDGRILQTIPTPKGELSRIYRKDARGYEKFFFDTIDDAEKLLSIPYCQELPDLKTFFRMKEKFGNKVVTQATYTNPMGLVWEWFSPELLSVCTIDHRDLLFELLNMFYQRISTLLDYLLDNNVAPVYYMNGAEAALPPLMSPKDFDDFVIAYDRKLVNKIHAKGNVTVVHCHGKVNRYLDKFIEMGTDGLNVLEPPPSGDVILKEAKKKVDGKLCLIGNIQYEEFTRCSKEEIEYRVKNCISDAAPGGGFILSPCAFPYESPIPEKTAENFIHYLKMGRKYGEYPIH